MHSASWQSGVDFTNKTVAVLGCGSSGVQIVPAILPGEFVLEGDLFLAADLFEVVKDIVTFIRSPTWITAGFAQSKAGPGGTNFECRGLVFPHTFSSC